VKENKENPRARSAVLCHGFVGWSIRRWILRVRPDRRRRPPQDDSLIMCAGVGIAKFETVRRRVDGIMEIGEFAGIKASATCEPALGSLAAGWDTEETGGGGGASHERYGGTLYEGAGYGFGWSFVQVILAWCEPVGETSPNWMPGAWRPRTK
jgi:hypothetical protein